MIKTCKEMILALLRYFKHLLMSKYLSRNPLNIGQHDKSAAMSVFPTPPHLTPVPTASSLTALLDNEKFGPGNRPIWDMKEGRVSSRYPDLIKALRRESDPSRRRQILAGHKTRIFGPSRGTVPTGVISQ